MNGDMKVAGFDTPAAAEKMLAKTHAAWERLHKLNEEKKAQPEAKPAM
jgi:hypothetical protein